MTTWSSWGAIPLEDKEHFWQHFKVTRHRTYSLFIPSVCNIELPFHYYWWFALSLS